MSAVSSPQLEPLLSAVRTLEPLIRTHADEAERNRRLSQPVVSALLEADLFRMYSPQAFGGFEVTPLTFYRVVEEVARIDGSTGWCLTIGGGGPLVGAYLSDRGAEDIFGRDPHVIISGALFPFGRAEVSKGGYTVSGRWPYASGCQHCTWLLAFCNVFEADQIRLTNGELPEVRVAFVPLPQVSILETWEVSGLAGTGSHDFVIEQVFVPEDYTWQFGPGMQPVAGHYQGPLYRFPFMGSFALPVSAVALGIAQGAVNTTLELAHSKHPAGTTELLRDRPLVQVRMAEAVALIRSARAWLHASLQQVWDATVNEEDVSFATRADMLLAAANAARSAAAAVDIAYTMAGGTANYRRSPLQRALRDIHAVTQHAVTASQQYESAGRMLLGLSPSQPFILL